MSSKRSIAPRKIETVSKLKNLIQKHQTIGIVQMESIGAKTVQKLRADLRNRATIVAAKNTLMRRALADSKIDGSDLLSEYIKGPAVFLFTNDSPYQIANYLDKNKVKAPAKAGQISPITVTVSKMNTGFLPGGVISELNSIGLPTRIEDGTVAIPSDTQVLAPGERVSATLASILTRLEIEPFLVGLSLDVVLENGEIIDHENLIVDFESYRNDLIFAHQSAMNLAVEAGILNSDTAPLLISKAKRNAFALAASIGYINEETASMVLGRAHAHALALARAASAVDASAVPAELL
ncbi:MAG: 50S ribosomal protein L10 [Candidatus Heimdallarchaeota archaeon LC_2]|nr:MAG: 50S ribosomal protein L10 [Candidatus Heimdallarchaeota archaeon LC_2]